jgi:hypothetical protein
MSDMDENETRIPDEIKAPRPGRVIIAAGVVAGALCLAVFFSVVAFDAAFTTRDGWSALAYFLCSAMWLGGARWFWDNGVRRG